MAQAHTFSTASLLGFAGGEQSVQALSVAHVSGRRRLPAAYNAPGSYAASKAYTALSEAPIWDGLHPGVSANPTALTSTSDSLNGPRYTATVSGTVMPTTGPVAKLLLESSRSLPINVAEGRVTTPLSVTVVELADAPETEEHPLARVSAPVWIPVVASAASAVACGVMGDFVSCGMIGLGMACNGLASRFIQNGDLTFTRPATTAGAPAGDGYLEFGNEIIILKGSESAVASVTRGSFTLRYKNESEYSKLKTGGMFLSIQCFVQLLFVPFGTVFGQFIFLLSMAVAWLFNAYVARQEKAAWKRLVLEDILRAPSMVRYSLGTRTTAAVFIMQVLKPKNMEEQLAALLPNNTPVWKNWRQTVARRLTEEKPQFGSALAESSTFKDGEKKLIGTLFGDAQAAVDAFAKSMRKF